MAEEGYGIIDQSLVHLPRKVDRTYNRKQLIYVRITLTKITEAAKDWVDQHYWRLDIEAR